MPINLDVATFVHRILRHMTAFKAASDVGQDRLTDTQIPEDQEVLGIYENFPNSLDEAIVVTDTSLWAFGKEETDEIPYTAMASVTWSPDEKRTANSVRIDMNDETVKFVPVRGEQGGGRDVFEFVRFLSRVIGELRRVTG